MTTYCLPKVPVSRAWYLAVVFLLTGCIAPALMFSPQGQLMWALLKPLVGLDPNEVNLFEQPMIKGRMQSLLGPNYETAVSLLKTANEIQQEGPLFYLISRHTPVPLLAEKAGFVWNSETNQMAVLLVTGGAPQIFAEQLNKQAEQLIPSWPKDLADYANPAALQQKAINAASEQLSPALPTELGAALNIAADPKAAIKAQQDAMVKDAKNQLPADLGVVADSIVDPKAALAQQAKGMAQQALSPLQQQQAEALVQLKAAEEAVVAAETKVQQAKINLQQSTTDSMALEQATQQFSAAQQQLLSARQALEVAKAKNKALASASL